MVGSHWDYRSDWWYGFKACERRVHTRSIDYKMEEGESQVVDSQVEARCQGKGTV